MTGIFDGKLNGQILSLFNFCGREFQIAKTEFSIRKSKTESIQGMYLLRFIPPVTDEYTFFIFQVAHRIGHIPVSVPANVTLCALRYVRVTRRIFKFLLDGYRQFPGWIGLSG